MGRGALGLGELAPVSRARGDVDGAGGGRQMWLVVVCLQSYRSIDRSSIELVFCSIATVLSWYCVATIVHMYYGSYTRAVSTGMAGKHLFGAISGNKNENGP